MKKKVFFWLLALLTIIVLPLVLLNNKKFQHGLLQHYAKILALEFNLEPDFDSFRLQVDNNVFIQFEGLQFADSMGQVFFRSKRLDINAKLLPLLLKKHLNITDLRLIEADIQLYKTFEDSPLNIAYLERLFKSDKQLFNSVSITSLLLKDCSFRYDLITAARQEGLDINHLELKALNAKMLASISHNEPLTLKLTSLSLEEQSGFMLDNLSLNAWFHDQVLILDKLKLLLPASSLVIDSMQLAFPNKKVINAEFFVLTEPAELELKLNFSDIRAFLPLDLQLEDNKASLVFTALGDANRFNLSEMHFQMDSVLYFTGNIDINAMTDKKEFKLLSSIDFLHIQPEAISLIQRILSIEDSVMPAVLYNLGTLDFCGKVSIESDYLQLDGDILTDPGNVSTWAQMHYSVQDDIYDFNLKLHSDAYALNNLLNSPKKLGRTAFNIGVNGKKVGKEPLIADLNAEVHSLQLNDYTYQDLLLKAYYNGLGFYRVSLHSGDQHCLLDMDFSLNKMGDDATIALGIDVEHVDLHKLNWMKGDGNSDLSFRLQSEIKGNTLAEFKGNLSMDSLRFENNGVLFEMDNFYALTGDNKGERYLLLKSALLEGWMYGNVDLSTLVRDVEHKTLLRFFPAFYPDRNSDFLSGNNYDFRFQLNDTRLASQALGLPFSLPSGLSFKGFFREEIDLFSLQLEADTVEFEDFKLQNVALSLGNPLDSLQAQFSGKLFWDDTTRLDVEFKAAALNNDLNWSTYWLSDSGAVYRIELSNLLRFERMNASAPLQIYSALHPSEFVVRDSLWQIEPSDIQWDGEKLKIKDFLIHHNNQFVKLDGALSDSNQDELWVDLNDVNLDFLFDLLSRKESTLRLGGKISGAAQVINLFEEPKLNAALTAENFSLNKFVLGDLNFNSTWNEQLSGIEMNGILTDQGKQLATASGAIFPKADSIYLWIDAQKVRLHFLNGFLDGGVLENLDGYGSGYVEIAGTFADERVGITSDCYVENGAIGVELLHCNYYFNDSIHLNPYGLYLNNIHAQDYEGNKVLINGSVAYNYFKDVVLDIAIQANRLKVFDVEASYAEPFYGKVYATGTALLDGPIEDLQMDINLRTDERSHFAITLLEESDVGDYSFIEFVDRSKKDPKDSIQDNERLFVPIKKLGSDNPTNKLTLNLQMEATPSAEIILITNPSTGDEIRGRGTGSIRLVYDNSGELELYGRYTLESGSYQFIIQDLLRRDFSILQGSTINFSGNPMEADMNINAVYSVVNVALSDLLDEAEIASLNLNRSSIPVNCTLLLSDELQHPNIQLGLDFPSGDEELKRRVMNVINTDEMLNRQIVYLMLLNRFAAVDNTNQTNDNVNAVVGATLSTLSNQLNNMIYQALGSSFLTFDFNYRYDDLVAQGLGEWQLAMSSQLMDNRLIINGNIGSREDLVNNNTQFIGDFDLEYKFSQSGRWRLKMFNRSNDSRYFKSAMTTQGVGLGYRESFNNLLELRQLLSERIASQIIQSLKESDLKKDKLNTNGQK